MNLTQFVLTTTIILLLAFALGWMAHWALHRFSRKAGENLSEMGSLAQALHEAEETRDEAIRYFEAREDEMQNQINDLQAELHATAEALHEVRASEEEMRNYIEQMHSGK